MSAHTPGPWRDVFVGSSSAGDDGVDVYEVLSERSRVCEYTSEANARLIAAAPDMLAALLAVKCHFDAVGNQTKMAADVHRAIAKATGAQ